MFDENNKLEVLNLKSNNISDVGLGSFKNDLLKLKNLKELNLYDNQFGDQGFKILLLILKAFKFLKVLILPNCGITQVGIKDFAECFNKDDSPEETSTKKEDNKNGFFGNLETLNLTSNPFGDESEENLIKILSSLKSLKKYNLGQTQLSSFSKHRIF